MPGERALARQFHVNAKTLSKALTDLAAEGVLDRSIGRGTYVKGQAPAAATRWLLVCNPNQLSWDQVIRAAHPGLDVVTDVESLRPSFLHQFKAVIDMASGTPDSFVRDLVVRNIPVVVVGKEPQTYSTHAVLFDKGLAISQVGRDLLLGGHQRLAAVEERQSTLVAETLRKTAARYSADAQVDACFPGEAASMVANGVTAFVCQSAEWAAQVQQELERLDISVPDRVSVGAIGSTTGEAPCSGYFLPRTKEVDAIVQLLSAGQNSRPTTMWLVGRFVDRGTIAPLCPANTDAPMRYEAATA